MPYKSQCILCLINDLNLWINPRCLVGAMDGSVVMFWKNECQGLTFGGFLWSKICRVFSYFHALCASISVWTTWSESSRGRSIKPREVVLLTCVHADRFWSACCHFSNFSFFFLFFVLFVRHLVSLPAAHLEVTLIRNHSQRSGITSNVLKENRKKGFFFKWKYNKKCKTMASWNAHA